MHNATREEIAAELGVSPQRVSQMEAEILEKLKKILVKRGYKADDFFGETPDLHYRPPRHYRL